MPVNREFTAARNDVIKENFFRIIVNCSDVPMAPPDLPMSATGTKVTIVDDLNNDDSNDGASDSNNGASADKVSSKLL